MPQEYDIHRPALTFDILDDFIDLQTEALSLLQVPVSCIGPVVELVYGAKLSPQICSTDDMCPEARLLLKQLSEHDKQHRAITSFCPLEVEFRVIPDTKPAFGEVVWSTFCTRVQRAGEQAGVPRRLAQALSGSLNEMASNGLEHSGNVNSCVAGYRWRRGFFEYVVSDSGVGVLSSLQTNPDYRWVSDSGQALNVAIRDGESRYGKGTGRGMGFHDLITNLARRGSFVRFRTGDHALIIDGTGETIREEIRQTANFDGFLVSIALSA